MTAPKRTCIGCRTKAEAADLVRIGRADDGSLAVGRSIPGRGAWLCAGSLPCLEIAVRRRAFGRAFRAPISDGAPDLLRAFFEKTARTCEDG